MSVDIRSAAAFGLGHGSPWDSGGGSLSAHRREFQSYPLVRASSPNQIGNYRGCHATREGLRRVVAALPSAPPLVRPDQGESTASLSGIHVLPVRPGGTPFGCPDDSRDHRDRECGKDADPDTRRGNRGYSPRAAIRPGTATVAVPASRQQGRDRTRRAGRPSGDRYQDREGLSPGCIHHTAPAFGCG